MNKFIRAGFASFMILGLSQGQAYSKDEVPNFSSAEIAWSVGPGKSAVKGHAHFSIAGKEASCFRNRATLRAYSAFAEYRNTLLYGGTKSGSVTPATLPKNVPNGSDEYANAVRTSLCDEEGRFEFLEIPAGSYYLTVQVVPIDDSDTSNAMIVMKKIEVKGSSVDIDMNPSVKI